MSAAIRLHSVNRTIKPSLIPRYKPLILGVKLADNVYQTIDIGQHPHTIDHIYVDLKNTDIKHGQALLVLHFC